MGIDSTPRIAMTIDLVGLFCPEPILQVNERISDIDVGDALVLLADDPSAESDVASWTKRTGHDLMSTVEEDGVTKFTIRRTS